MAPLATNAMTLVDLAKTLDPDGKPARIIELLSQTNELLTDMLFVEGNLKTGHMTTVRTGLPAVFWRLINQGVQPSKAHNAQIEEQTGMLEAYSQVDKDLAELGGNPGAVRMSEARAFIEAMGQEVAQTLFYGTLAAPEEFVGLTPRYSSKSAGNAENIIDAGGTGSDNASIWEIAHGEETFHGIYPQGSSAGLKHEDLGLETADNAGGVSGALQRVYRDHWQWKVGIALRDWRYVVRICNIDVSDIVAGTAPPAANIVRMMADADERIPNNLGRRAFYMNRTMRRYLRFQEHDAVVAGGGLTYSNIAGQSIMMFGEVPIRRVDALLNTEARVL
jgi:hypothetical protein